MWPPNTAPKQWGRSEFWGLGSDYDPDWVLTESQKQLRVKLIDVCRQKIRPHAIQCDRNYIYPRESMKALAELGLLGLIIPKDLGGLGEDNVCAVMVTETVARYGCPSTSMVYTMHIAAVATLLFRYHNNPRVRDLLSRINKEALIGTLSYSDPATGGHYWYPLSSKVKSLDERTIQLLKVGSWATSAGCADWYTVQTVSPNFGGDYSDLSCFLVYKDEMRANTDDWKSLGMHGNMSGPLVIEGKFDLDRMIGPPGDGRLSNDECVDPYYLMCAGGCWSGVALACMDLAKRHVTRKSHADVGFRICDYPTIQDYFGECVTMTNASRCFVYSQAQAMDKATDKNDWSKHADLTYAPRTELLHWFWQAKFVGAKMATEVSDKMLHACGGSGYKTDLGLERILRDAKASWVMGPSNEVLRQWVGRTSLMGLEVMDYWEQVPNKRSVHHELKKMNLQDKKALVQNLMKDIEMEERGDEAKHPFQDTDFENPFNTCPPAVNNKVIKTPDGVSHAPALKPDAWVPLVLKSYTDVSEKMASFVFSLPNPTDHTGCMAGQFVVVKVNIKGREQYRYFSPVTRPDDFGKIELVLRFETQGLMSQHFKALKPGDKIEFQGPCGGFEYVPNSLDELTLLASGGGVTPGMQLIRTIMNNPADKTKIKLLYYSESYSEILYREELDKYAEKDQRLQIVYTLGEITDNWQGEEGFIDTAMIDNHVTKPNGVKNKIVMCGGPTMSIACLYSLKILGFPSDSAYIYGQFGTEQVRAVYGRNVPLTNHRCDNVV